MATQTHRVDIVPVKLEPHPNADSLSVVRIHNFTVCVRTEDWKDRGIGAYIQPDSVVPDEPAFAFLKKNPEDTKSLRIRVKRLRGVISMGLLMPAPEGARIGDDVTAQIGVTHYEPPIAGDAAEMAPPPVGIWAPKYDVESMYRYASAFVDGEPVYVTEKIHGANARFVFDGEQMHAGSRGTWKAKGSNEWWRALQMNPWIEEWCRANPRDVLYGEVFGWVQSLRYGADSGQIFFRAFDILRGGRFLDVAEFCQSLPWGRRVPIVATCAFNFSGLQKMAEGKSLIAPQQIREGIVVRPMVERQHDEIGRVQLKLVSNEYLEKY